MTDSLNTPMAQRIESNGNRRGAPSVPPVTPTALIDAVHHWTGPHLLPAQVLAPALSGELSPGTRLPTLRQLSGDLGAAPGTVARAFREQGAEGVLSSRRRHGTPVTDEAVDRARKRG